MLFCARGQKNHQQKQKFTTSFPGSRAKIHQLARKNSPPPTQKFTTTGPKIHHTPWQTFTTTGAEIYLTPSPSSKPPPLSRSFHSPAHPAAASPPRHPKSFMPKGSLVGTPTAAFLRIPGPKESTVRHPCLRSIA